MLFQCLECIIVQLLSILHFVHFSNPALRPPCTHDWGGDWMHKMQPDGIPRPIWRGRNHEQKYEQVERWPLLLTVECWCCLSSSAVFVRYLLGQYSTAAKRWLVGLQTTCSPVSKIQNRPSQPPPNPLLENILKPHCAISCSKYGRPPYWTFQPCL